MKYSRTDVTKIQLSNSVVQMMITTGVQLTLSPQNNKTALISSLTT